VLLTFLLAQAERLKPRIAYFDKDRGAEPFIRAIGGRYDVIAPASPPASTRWPCPTRRPTAPSCPNGSPSCSPRGRGRWTPKTG
jgi:hypothetical protein